MEVSFGLSKLERGLERIGIKAAKNPRPVRSLFRKGYPVVEVYLDRHAQPGQSVSVLEWKGVRRVGTRWLVSAIVTAKDGNGTSNVNQEFVIYDRVVLESRRAGSTE